MITTAIINIGYYILSVLVSVFPVSSGFPSDVQTAFSYVGSYVGMLDPLIPISTLSSVVLIAVTIELLIFSFKIFSWIFSKIPIIGR